MTDQANGSTTAWAGGNIGEVVGILDKERVGDTVGGSDDGVNVGAGDTVDGTVGDNVAGDVVGDVVGDAAGDELGGGPSKWVGDSMYG